MAGVNGVEIKVGQVWRCRDGKERTVSERDEETDTPWVWDLNDKSSVTEYGCEFDSDEERHRDLIELVKDENGFTIWRGGEQPPETVGRFVTFATNEFEGWTREADLLHWAHNGSRGDIVAYKVVEQPADSATLAEETLSALGWTFDGQAWVEQPRIDTAAPAPMMEEPGYELLAYVLERAYNQAALGKGKERHANGEPFDEQVMQDGARRFGVGALLFQAFKKSEESQRLPLDRGVNELLGAIVYLAGAVIRREADAQEGGA